jgi:hypothetical protein
MILLQYWARPDYSSGEASARIREYGVGSTPTTCFNGPQNKAVGETSYSRFKDKVDSERERGAAVAITAAKAISGNAISVSADVFNSGNVSVENAEVMFVAYEDLGDSEKHFVVLAIESGGTVDNLPRGGTESFSEEFDLSDSETGNVEAVVFLQSAGSSREVLQAALAS